MLFFSGYFQGFVFVFSFQKSKYEASWHKFVWVNLFGFHPASWICPLGVADTGVESLLHPTCTAFFSLLAAEWGRWELSSPLHPANTIFVRVTESKDSGYYQVGYGRSAPCAILLTPQNTLSWKRKQTSIWLYQAEHRRADPHMAYWYHLAGES